MQGYQLVIIIGMEMHGLLLPQQVVAEVLHPLIYVDQEQQLN